MMDAMASNKEAPEALGRPGRLPVTAREAVDKMVQAGLLDDLMDQVDGGGLQLTGEGGFLPEMVKRVLEAGLEAERTGHLGYEKHDRPVMGRATPAMVSLRSGWAPRLAILIWRCRGTGTAASSPGWCRRANAGWVACRT